VRTEADRYSATRHADRGTLKSPDFRAKGTSSEFLNFATG
jgi:hypothetical protein